MADVSVAGKVDVLRWTETFEGQPYSFDYAVFKSEDHPYGADGKGYDVVLILSKVARRSLGPGDEAMRFEAFFRFLEATYPNACLVDADSMPQDDFTQALMLWYDIHCER